MPREFKLKGLNTEQIKKLSIEEFKKIIDSRSRRTLNRGLNTDEKILLEKIRKNPDKFHKTHVRNMIILPEMIGIKFGVYTGKEWFQLVIEPKMIGHRLGEFAIPVKTVNHSSPGIGASRGSKNVSVK